MIAAIIYAVTGLIEFIIGLRILFRLAGANPANGLVDWIYDWSSPFVTPFAGIFGQQATVAGSGAVTQSVFDWTALIALVVYGVAGAFIARLIARAAPQHGPHDRL